MQSRVRRSERWTLANFSLLALLSSFGVSMPNVALPLIAREFSVSTADVRYVVVSYLAASTIAMVFAGRLGDLWGRRRVLLTGVVIFTASAIASALSNSLTVLLVARAAQGTGAAILLTLTMALIAESVSKEKLGASVGLIGTMSAVGTLSGPAAGGVLLSVVGWRGAFLSMAALGAVGFVSAYQIVVDRPPRDIVFRFWRFESLVNRQFAWNLVMTFVVSMVMMSTLIVGPFYLSQTLALDPLHVGAVMSVGPIMSMLSGTPAGRLVDRWGTARVTMIGLIEMVIGFAALATLPRAWGVVGYALSSVILSPGYQLFQAANTTSVLQNVASHDRGGTAGLLNFGRNLGLISGSLVLGALFSTSGMMVTYAVAGSLVASVLAIATLFARKNKNDPQTKRPH